MVPHNINVFSEVKRLSKCHTNKNTHILNICTALATLYSFNFNESHFATRELTCKQVSIPSQITVGDLGKLILKWA